MLGESLDKRQVDTHPRQTKEYLDPYEKRNPRVLKRIAVSAILGEFHLEGFSRGPPCIISN
jgi:hypothetical protein